jgi:hypothetical protein
VSNTDNQSALKTAYDSIPCELSGARSKNRFRLELLWGVSKMFDLFDKPEFCVVFDYKCDVEVHLPNVLEFHQIKTHKVQSPYTFAKISKQDATTGKSVLGQLYLLRNCASDDVDVRVAIVSNAFFKLKQKIFEESEVIVFSELDAKAQKTIRDALAKEITNDEVDLSKISYIYTSMDLSQPEDAIRGKIVKRFEQIKGQEPIKPNALYRLIADTAQGKACYELALPSYEAVVEHKGFTRAELNTMLDRYYEKADDCVDKTMQHIESMNVGVAKKKKFKSALLHVRGELITSNELKNKEAEISDFLSTHADSSNDDLDLEGMVDVIIDKFGNGFSLEFPKEQVYVLALLIVNRWEGNFYE